MQKHLNIKKAQRRRGGTASPRRNPMRRNSMQRRLNAEEAQRAMTGAGLTQTAVAKALGVSKESVSQWLSAKSFPRPGKLLELGRLLDLPFGKLVVEEDPHTPRVAFRKMKGTKTKSHHVERAQEIGRFLRHLVPYLPFDALKTPSTLKLPSRDYEYLQEVAARIRKEMNLGSTGNVKFTHLIRQFLDLQAVVVPVMWGAKSSPGRGSGSSHENAMHIYLPDSKSTWIYLNLDTNLHDFKFWMAHELGHCLSPSLEGEEAEDFADAFAATLLFPRGLAKRAYESINARRSANTKITEACEWAKKFDISPYTVIRQVQAYASDEGKPKVELGNQYYGAITNFNKRYKNVAEILLHDAKSGDQNKPDVRFNKRRKNVAEKLLHDAKSGDQGKPDARQYIAVAEKQFQTPFFDLLKKYLEEYEKGPGFVQAVLDTTLLDARSIHAELT